MKNIQMILAAAALLATTPMAFAQSGAATGAAGGAVTGAIVGGPVGAVVGGVVGAVAGSVLAPPPVEVRTYVTQQRVPSYAYTGEIVVGRPAPESMVIYQVPNQPSYVYGYVNNRYVIIDPKTRIVMSIDG